MLSLSFVAGVTIATVQGCAARMDGPQEVAAYLQGRAAVREADAGRYAQTPPSEPESPKPDEPSPAPRPLETLRDFLMVALENNPDIRSAEEVARSKAERIAQVTALPDPMLATKTLPEPVRTAEGDNYFVLNVTQRIPAPEKLSRAGEIALQGARMALQKLQETRLRVIADVKRSYFQLYIVERSLQVTGENQELLVGLIDVARSQVAAGRRGQDDVLRAQVELSNLEAELVALRQRRVTAVARLNELLDRDPSTPIEGPPDFGVRKADLALEKLLAQAVKSNPSLERLREQVQRDTKAVDLAKLAYWPDFTFGLEWMEMEPRKAFQPLPNPRTGQLPMVSKMSEDGSDNWAVIFGFSLPIWREKIAAGIREARYRLAASQREYRSNENRVRFEVRDALERVRSQRELATLFDGTIIPQARQAYEVSQASYTAGKTDFLFVIDNWRKWLVFTIQYYRSLGELERSVADLEQAIGMSLSDAGGP